MATYTIFAGVNGAGKTSIYKSIYYKKNESEICNEINIYDNTNKFKRVAYICDGIIRYLTDL